MGGLRPVALVPPDGVRSASSLSSRGPKASSMDSSMRRTMESRLPGRWRGERRKWRKESWEGERKKGSGGMGVGHARETEGKGCGVGLGVGHSNAIKSISTGGPKPLSKRDRRSVWAWGQKLALTDGPKNVSAPLKAQNFSRCPEPAPTRQDPIRGASSTWERSLDTLAPHDSECGRGRRLHCGTGSQGVARSPMATRRRPAFCVAMNARRWSCSLRL
jgi:hypothetical protein